MVVEQSKATTRMHTCCGLISAKAYDSQNFSLPMRKQLRYLLSGSNIVKLKSVITLHLASLALLAPLGSSAAEPNLQSLSLSQALALSATQNYDIRLGALAVKNANAATLIANAAPNPVISLQTTNINQKLGVGPGSLRDKTVDTTLRIDQLIERGSKRELRTENATYLEQATQADFSLLRRQLKIGVTQAYYALLSAQEKVAVTQETIGLFDNTLTAAQKRKKAGDIAGADVQRLQVDVLRAKNEARQAEADLAKARLLLAQLMGVSENIHGIAAGDAWPAVGPAMSTSELETFLDQSPQVKAANARLNAAAAAHKLSLAARTRDVSVGLQFEHYPSSAANTQGGGNSVGISVQFPIFARYDFQGEILASEAALDSARENLKKTRDVVRIDMLQALQDVQSASDRVLRYEQELLMAAKKSSDAAEFAFRNGALSVMDVLDARRTYRAIQLDSITAHADYAKSLAVWQALVLKDSE